MPTTMTLKNIPDDVYERLETAALAHRRSLNSEAIACLESVLLPGKMNPTEQLARIQALRTSLAQRRFVAEEIVELKSQGRL
jgi:plasmid stability protein